jgi:hypothetical protein
MPDAVRACEVSLNSAASTQKHKLPCDLHYAVTVAVVVDHWPGKAAFKKGDYMGAFADFDRYDGLGLAQLVRTGEVKSSELVEEAISRIETRNPQINAIVFKTFESARPLRQRHPPGHSPACRFSSRICRLRWPARR